MRCRQYWIYWYQSRWLAYVGGKKVDFYMHIIRIAYGGSTPPPLIGDNMPHNMSIFLPHPLHPSLKPVLENENIFFVRYRNQQVRQRKVKLKIIYSPYQNNVPGPADLFLQNSNWLVPGDKLQMGYKIIMRTDQWVSQWADRG